MLSLLLAVLLATAPTAPEASPESGSLTIRVAGLKSNKGRVSVALFDSAESFAARSGPLLGAELKIRRKRCEWVVPDLQPGSYAVALYQDRNRNGALDRSGLGIPREPYGFSNNPKTTFGPPSFEKARIEFDGTDATIEVLLRGKR